MWRTFPFNSPLLLCLSVITSSTHGQVFTFSSCPSIAGQAVTATGVSGDWFEYERTPSIRDHYIRCTIYSIGQDTTNDRFDITVAGLNKHTGAVSSAKGYATYPDGDTVGKWFVRFRGSFLSRYPLTYYIVTTATADADVQGSYMVLVACTPLKVGSIRNVIALTDTRFPSQATIDSIEAAAQIYIPLNNLSKTDQTNCV